ncbi:hypothetical protein ILYODFUR_021797 [Ilyodon furcidens]|uniref:Secreted protein n=1 Tax=Ilyodon furcidens TaxID=33524 RepID=A0ABV0U947_9TELE
MGLLVMGFSSSLMIPRALNSFTILSISSTAPGFRGYCRTGGCTPPSMRGTYFSPRSSQSFLNRATLAEVMIFRNFSFPAREKSLSFSFCSVTSGTSTALYHS